MTLTDDGFSFFVKSPRSCWRTSIQCTRMQKTCRVCAHERQRERGPAPCVFPPGCGPPPSHRHVVAATIGPCSGNILLTFGGSCPCHLETKTNGPTSLKILHCARSAPFLSAFHSPAKTLRLCACLRGRKLIVVALYVVFLFLVACN